MYNFTNSPGGRRFGRIWVSGGNKKPPILPYYDFDGFVTDRCYDEVPGMGVSDASDLIKQYSSADLLEEGDNYKLYSIDEYVIWDDAIKDTTSIQQSYRNAFLDYYAYGTVNPKKEIAYFGDNKTAIGMAKTPNDDYLFQVGDSKTTRIPFCYRLVGKYIRYAEDAAAGNPTLAEVQAKRDFVIAKLGTYRDSGITYAGCKQEIVQPTGTLYTAHEIPSSFTQQAENELYLQNTSSYYKYIYEKGAVINGANDEISFQVVSGHDTGYSSNPTNMIADYKNPYRMFIYPMIPYITMTKNGNTYSYSKMQKPQYYPAQYQSYLRKPCVYGAPSPSTIDGITYQSATWNASRIGLDTSYSFTQSLSSRVYERLAIKYNVREQLYKIPINCVRYRQGSRSYGSRRPHTAEGFVGYISLFEIDPSLLPT